MILLLSMVLVSSVLVALAGGALVADLQSRAQAAQANDAMSVVDRKVTQAVATEDARSLSAIGGPGGEPVVRERGSATIAWVNGPNASLPPESSSCRVDVDPLGAIELEQGSDTVAYQAGGVWRSTPSGTVVQSEPKISYDDGRLQLDVVQIARDSDGSARVAAVDSTASSQLASELERAARCGSGRTMVLRVRSRYHEGWHDHLSGSFAGSTDVNVSVEHDPSAAEVTARIEDVRSPGGEPRIRAVGSADLVGTDTAGRVTHGSEPITVETTLRGTGGAVTDQPITLAIDTGSGTITETTTVSVPEDTERTVSISVEQSAYAARLDPGEQYSYTISTEGTPLVTGGSVYVGASESDLSLGDPSHSLENGTLTISAPVANHGVTAGLETVSLQVVARDDRRGRGYRIDPVTVERAAGATARVSWELSAERLVSGPHRYRIASNDDAVSGSVTIPATGVETSGSQVTFERSRTVTVTALGPEVSAEEQTDFTAAGILGGDRSDGRWSRTDDGTATLDWPGRTVPFGAGVEPPYDDDGGWRPESGSVECLRREDSECQLYGFPNTSSFQWHDDGGYALDWRVDRTGNWSWEGEGTFGEHGVSEKYWWPVTLDIGLEDTRSGRIDRLSPWRDEETSGTDHLNQYRDRNRVRRHSMTVDAGTRLSFEATAWNCGSGWDRSGRDTYSGDEATGEHLETADWQGIWHHYDCTDLAEPLLQVDSRTETNPENVRSRDAVANTVPELRAGNPRQQSADELLGDRFVERHENSTGVLDLDQDEFVFLFEITDEPESDVTADEFFGQARAADGPGDPNFNDLIVLVELGDTRAAGGGAPRPLSPSVTTGAGESVESESGTVAAGGGAGLAEDDGVEVRVDADSVLVRG
jgi:hypothetical protein